MTVSKRWRVRSSSVFALSMVPKRRRSFAVPDSQSISGRAPLLASRIGADYPSVPPASGQRPRGNLGMTRNRNSLTIEVIPLIF